MGVKSANQLGIKTGKFSVSITTSGAVSSALSTSTGGNIYTGGRITSPGNVYLSAGYRYHVFLSSGTFTSSGSGTIDILLVGGGGGGGQGGGGAGGTVTILTNKSVTAQAYTVTVGTNGTGGRSGSYGSLSPTAGSASSVTGITGATAAGGAAGDNTSYAGNGFIGGSGFSSSLPIATSGNVYAIYGTASNFTEPTNSGQTGQNGTSDNGFLAYTSQTFPSIGERLGSNVYFGAGGGGGCRYYTNDATRGYIGFAGLGKAGGTSYAGFGGYDNPSASPSSAAPNSGSGGSGGRVTDNTTYENGGNGGSGVVIIRYPV